MSQVFYFKTLMCFSGLAALSAPALKARTQKMEGADRYFVSVVSVRIDAKISPSRPHRSTSLRATPSRSAIVITKVTVS